jgi:hypothetical protein
MKVIGAGLGRTGTLSLKVALERLGFGPCYHMLEVFEHPDHVGRWTAAARGEAVDWDALFTGYRATTDWPACSFWRDLAAAYPEARVLLSVRDPERWYDSMRSTIHAVFQRLLSVPGDALPEGGRPEGGRPELARYREMIDAVVWRGTFGGRFEDRAHAIDVFRRHADEVRRALPAERLLVYELGQGWEPLCAFLEVPVPDEPFPHLNDAASFQARVQGGGGPQLLVRRRSGGPPS